MATGLSVLIGVPNWELVEDGCFDAEDAVLLVARRLKRRASSCLFSCHHTSAASREKRWRAKRIRVSLLKPSPSGSMVRKTPCNRPANSGVRLPVTAANVRVDGSSGRS